MRFYCRYSYLFFVILLISTNANAQSSQQTITISWQKSGEVKSVDQLSFQGCGFQKVGKQVLPTYFEQIKINNTSTKLRLTNLVYEALSGNIILSATITQFAANPLSQFTTSEAGNLMLNYEVFPFRVNESTGKVEQLTSFSYVLEQLQPANGPKALYKKANNTLTSVLSVGDWHRFAIKETGIYKLNVADLKALNLDLAKIEASSFQIMGTSGGLVPEVINTPRIDDLKEIAIRLVDANNNNRLDGDDHLLFYAEGPHIWRFDEGLQQYIHEYNVFDENNFIYLTHSQKSGKRITTTGSGQGQSFEKNISGYHQLFFHELELVNFIASGRSWFGESFVKQNQRTFSHTFENIRTLDTAYLRQFFVGRSVQNTSSYQIKVNGSNWHSGVIRGIDGDYDEPFIDTQVAPMLKPFTMTSAKVDLDYTLIPGVQGADAWLDYYELSIPVQMTFGKGQQLIYLKESAPYNSIRMEMNAGTFELWNVTDYFDATNQLSFEEAGKKYAVLASGKSHLRFVAFEASSTLKPNYSGKVLNQNIHALSNIDFVIVTHPDLLSQANRLSDFHIKHYNQKVAVVTINDIYNEFSGGKKDPTAIRDFLKMLYERGVVGGTPFKYACLFGDGTYDYKDRVDKNSNLVPTFQSRNSFVPSYSYASDDFFAILEDGEGYFDITGAGEGLDIGIGRIPCSDVAQAKIFVDKVVRYHEAAALGEWRNRLTFVADDEDGNSHFDDTEMISGFIDKQNPVYNIEKIYLDAYLQESYGSGQKYPQVNTAIDRNFDKGQFIFNYLGHGGPSGMGHERIVTRDQIRNWSNTNMLPVIITATCELTRYDDPSQDSPGELMLFDDNGGAIALISTSRLVYLNLNRDLNSKVLDKNMFDFSNGKPMLGDVMRQAKNRSQKMVNQRNFSLIGDPAMMLAYPKYNVITTAINDSLLGAQAVDTFKAFSKMKITGEVHREDGTLASDFNGFVYPTMFDKYQTYTTLGNDLASKAETFKMQNSVLYRGKVSAINGKFTFQFVVPKDIAYQFGNGKLVYYAEDGAVDGNGLDRSIVVGGSVSAVANDTKGPDIDLYMDDYSFVFGGISNSRPLLLCKIFDENGINTVGNGIGRDITAILDEGTENEQILVLNDYYQSTLDSYQEGELRYTFEALSTGRHTLKIRVWDVYNNSSEDYTEFVVADDDKLRLGHVLNYPNPFTTHTDFHFDHNKAGQSLDVQIQILSISGKVVNSLNYSSVSANGHFDAISWDGKDAFGDKLARGVYLYKVTVRSEDGGKSEAVEKLVLLK